MSAVQQKKPIVIAGPCSVESREQVIETCCRLAACGCVDMIRGGVWKPRTYPSCFQGVGDIGLEWLAEARKETGLPFGVEVANAHHVEVALRAGADMVWLGARTTGNPFSVQEVADALKGTAVIVLVKNGPMPDAELWTGAVERMLAAGINTDRLMLIHRGFMQSGAVGYRNPPVWHVALEMRRRFPQLRMLCDPSHMCGNRTGLAATAQKAIDLSYDGLFVESHCNPDAAWSDAAQQVTPERLSEILHGLKWRRKGSDTPAYMREMERLRLEIDQIDLQLFGLLSWRMGIAEEIGRIKRDNDVTIFQLSRWEEIVDNMIGRAEELGLSEGFVRMILDAVHMESIAHQNKVMND